jgi:hypothetical protein
LSRVVNDSDAVDVELVRPVPEAVYRDMFTGLLLMRTNQFSLNVTPDQIDTDFNGMADSNVVTRIWFMPLEIDHPDGTYLLTPVYVTVREL